MWSDVAVAVKTFYEEPIRVTDFMINISFIHLKCRCLVSCVHYPNVVSDCGAIIENEVPLRIVRELLEGPLKDAINAALQLQISVHEETSGSSCRMSVWYDVLSSAAACSSSWRHSLYKRFISKK